MKKLRAIAALALIFVMMAGIFAGCSSSKKENIIVMTINGQSVYFDEYLYYIKSASDTYNDDRTALESAMLETGLTFEELVKRDALQSLRVSYATFAKAKEYGVVLSDAEKKSIENDRAEMIKQMGSEKAYEDTLLEMGLTDALATKSSELTILTQKMLNEVFYAPNGKEGYSEKELKQYFDDNFIHIRQLFFSSATAISDTQKADKEALANDVFSQIKDGSADFEAMLDKYGEDENMASSDVGYVFPPGLFDESIEDVCFALDIDEMSDIIKDDTGWHIFKRLEIPADFYDNNKDNIRSTVSTIAFYNALEKWENEAVIEWRDNFEKMSVGEITAYHDAEKSKK